MQQYKSPRLYYAKLTCTVHTHTPCMSMHQHTNNTLCVRTGCVLAVDTHTYTPSTNPQTYTHVDVSYPCKKQAAAVAATLSVQSLLTFIAWLACPLQVCVLAVHAHAQHLCVHGCKLIVPIRVGGQLSGACRTARYHVSSITHVSSTAKDASVTGLCHRCHL
jgi:hypothetical protein